MGNLLKLALACVLFLALCSSARGEISTKSMEAVRKLPIEQKLQDEFIENYDDIRAFIVNVIMAPPAAGRASVECLGCRILMEVLVTVLRTTEDISVIVDALKPIACGALGMIDALHPDVCEGALDMYAEDLHYIINGHADVKPLDICGIILGLDGNCPSINSNFTDWKINIKGNKPALVNLPYLPESIQPVRILHLTDIHLDLDYEVGKNTACGKPVCCQNVEEDGADPETSAGPHGDYQCDMPVSAMYELFEHSAGALDNVYEFVMMTGDIPPHNIWNTTKQGNLDHYKTANDKLITLFSEERGIPVYPVIGNHEPHPCNLFPPERVWNEKEGLFDKAWMYDALAEAYGNQIKDPDAIAQFRKTGYYTIKHKNLRLVVINTNYCYTLNFWLYFDLIDPAGQLQWLADVLAAAETAGEPVYILGHIPPGKSNCWSDWAAKFNEIVIRFESTIKAQFYGHTHNDETAIFYDSSVKPARPANLLFIGASTTAYTDINPGYKVFYADGGRESDSTWEVMDHETWVYNLTFANNAGPNAPMPWKKLYTAKESFALKSLRPVDLDDLAYRILFDDELFQKYWTYYMKDSHVKGRCTNDDCKLNYVCEMVTANSGDYSHCKRFHAYFLIGETTTMKTETTNTETPNTETTNTETTTMNTETTTMNTETTNMNTETTTMNTNNGARSFIGTMYISFLLIISNLVSTEN